MGKRDVLVMVLVAVTSLVRSNSRKKGFSWGHPRIQPTVMGKSCQ